jgi:hypothetical protein
MTEAVENYDAECRLFTAGVFEYRDSEWVVEAEQPFHEEPEYNHAQVVWIGAPWDFEYPGAYLVLSEHFEKFEDAVERARGMFADIPGTTGLMEADVNDSITQTALRYYGGGARRPEDV